MRSLALLVTCLSLGSICLSAQTLAKIQPFSADLASASAVAPAISIANVEDKHERRLKLIWIASIFSMVAATGADAATSWHKKEANGFLASSDGTFGAKGLGIKAGLAGGIILPQILFRKHKDLRTAFTIGNFAQAGVFTGIAIHNAGVPR